MRREEEEFFGEDYEEKVSGQEESYENDEIDDDAVNELINRVNTAEDKNVELTQALSKSVGKSKDHNFLHLQISTVEMLTSLEHFYRGDFQAPDPKGRMVWKKQTNTELITFNEFGITSMMEIVSKYIDKNTILSDYNQERIYEILGDLGDDLVLFLLCNYEKMGMDTYFKKTKFRILITTTLHIIESTYRRALRSKTLEEVNQSKVVGQFGHHPSSQIPQQQRRPGFMSRMLNR